MNIYCDGSGWNGKKSKFCVCSDEGYLFKEVFEKELTNNQVEYFAVIHALSICEEGDKILTDSLLVVNQVSGKWKVKNEKLFPLWVKANKLAKEKNIYPEWIERNKNLAGNLLEK